MRLMFFYKVSKNTGSAQDIHSYTTAAKALGHEIVLYGKERSGNGLNYSLDVDSADALIFILESYLNHGRHVDLVQLASRLPRNRRVVIDCDGMYNEVIQADGDYNHPDADGSRQRITFCERLADKICQPTYRPLRPNVSTFLFHGYDPRWEEPQQFRGKEYGMFYVGNNWFRWNGLRRVLGAIEPIRDDVGRIGLAGYGWKTEAWWVEPSLRQAACYTDPQYLEQLRVELVGTVPVSEVITTMGRGLFSPVLLRPFFNCLGLVTCRTFETPAANTIPLFDVTEESVREIYGDAAVELVLPEDPTSKIADVLLRPEHYSAIVTGIRQRLRDQHSYASRIGELIEIVTR